MQTNKIKLTQFSPGAGCGCKIAPKDLEEILKGSRSDKIFENLIVGNNSNDDAAVYDIGNGQAVISTTDFFTPIVDNPFDFGRIAATNAISDIYAMGGTPIMAISILGWSLEKLSAEIAAEVIAGARQVCDSINIPVAGGHSINISEPIFGLAVTGTVDIKNIKKNNTATKDCILLLTKPLGIGLVTTAEKRGIVREADRQNALELMTTLNTFGQKISTVEGVKALTDVTGFGLLGHCLEMAEGSDLKAIIEFSKVPRIEGVDFYIEQKCMPGGTTRNFNAYGHKISKLTDYQKSLLCDPQTSGGLLIAVKKDAVNQIVELAKKTSTTLFEIGYLTEKKGDYFVEVRE